MANPQTIRDYLRNIEAQGRIPRQVILASDTKAQLRNMPGAGRLAKGQEPGPEHWKYHFPEGLGKRAISRVVLGADYQSTVNIQRQAEGKDPNFIPAPLWRGKGAADPELTAYMSYHQGTSHQVLRALPLMEGGQVQKDWQELYHPSTGKALSPEEVAVAQQFLRPEGRNLRQGAQFDAQGNVTVPGELEGKVPWRTFGAENITAIKGADEEEFTPIQAQKYVPPEVLAKAAGNQPPQKPPGVTTAAGDEEPGASDMGSEGGPAMPQAGADLASLASKVQWQRKAESDAGDEASPAQPDPGDEAVRRQNAAFAYRQLGSVIGGAFGSMAGPGGAAIGGALGGLFGHAAGGGTVSGANVAQAGLGAAAGAIGGVTGRVLGAFGSFVGATGHQAAGGGSGATVSGSGGGSGEDSMEYMIRYVYRWVKRMEVEGVKTQRQGGSGGTM